MVLALGLLAALPFSARADLAGEMDALFDTLVNVTEPTAHLGQRRGVVTGGSVVARNRIMNESLWHLVPPSFSAGCGGIDLFAGSFSFISVDQFVQLMRAIASNAAGYAFELALGAMCPECKETMEALQKKVQALNQGYLNSCQLAKGLVNDVADAFQVKHQDRTSLLAMANGLGDVFETRSSVTGEDPGEAVATHLPAEEREQLEGNLVWRVLKGHGTAGWFADGDDALLEAMMSLTGSVIVGERVEAPDGGGKSPRVTVLPGALLKVADLLNGSGAAPVATVRVYRCLPTRDVDDCKAPEVQAVAFRGMTARVRELLLGDPLAGTVGLVAKFRAGVGPVTGAEKAFMELAPNGLGAAIRTLARQDTGMAVLFVEQAAPVIALDLVQLMVRDLTRAVLYAAALDDHAYAKELLTQIRSAEEALRAEHTVLAARHGNAQDLLAYYQGLIAQVKGRRYVTSPQAPPRPGTDP
jgi:conjugative transfer pilus assembly protein TraH